MLGNNNPTTNDPAAFAAGGQSTLQNVVLTTVPSYTGNATLSVAVSPNDFSFISTQFAFKNGQAMVSVYMANDFPLIIASKVYTLKWSIQYPGGSMQQFQSTQHKIYLMHSAFSSAPTQDNPNPFRATTMRLGYVTNPSLIGQVGLPTGFSGAPTSATDGYLDTIEGILAAQTSNNPGQNADVHWPNPNNPWAALDGSSSGYDCESVSAIVAVQLQQLGYATSNVAKAYPTGALLPGVTVPPTDATTQQSQITTVQGVTGLFSLRFFTNYFEGYVTVNYPDSTQFAGYTVYPQSPAGHLSSTKCTVSPPSAENMLAFRILTATYSRQGAPYPVPYQQWFWDFPQNGTADPPSQQTFGQVALPLNNCTVNQ